MQDFALTGQHADGALAQDIQEFGSSGLYARFGKRVFDICFALLLLPILAPIILMLWLMVRRDGGNGFFGHRRVGRDGRIFKCWKLRSMVVDAETRLEAHLKAHPGAAAEWARDHKLTDDPRITGFGDFIRKTSLDELPQIWNVLKGEMSFVGPRPVVTKELEKYGNSLPAYLAQKPGITGLWQVSGRNDISYDERVAMDVAYLSQRSLSRDVAIIARTALAVVDRTGR